jgi:hypothetical protein
MSFLDENCLIFDNEEENRLEYTSIHNVTNKLLFILFRSSKKQSMTFCVN